jgi:cytochrome c oxidase subunit 2
MNMTFARFMAFCGLCFFSLLTSFEALAGQPVPKQIGLQPAASTVMEHIHDFHTFVLWIISAIVLFVFVLLLYVVVRFNAKANPVPSKTTHNVPLEIVWTLVPTIILAVIAVPSFRLLYLESRYADPEMTIKATGYQWYWGYEYPDHGVDQFMSYMIKDEEIDPTKNQVRLLSTDNPIVVPVDTVIEFQVTAADVLHAFAVPAFGIKTDAVPGRLNSTWVEITKPGVYYGQCSELCGTGHAFMPIEVHAVSKEEFATWVASKGGTMPKAEGTTEITTAPAEGDTAAAPLPAPTGTTEVAPAMPSTSESVPVAPETETPPAKVAEEPKSETPQAPAKY